MPSERRKIEVVPYNPEWKKSFEHIRAMLMEIIGDLVLDIEHVGSTSVEGLAAKPIIDIDAVMESCDVFPAIVERLAVQGFIHEGDLGIAGREAFKRTYDDGFMRYHLYVCPKDGRALREHIVFRDYLRTHPDACEEYGALKMANAKIYTYDIDGYVAAKTEFIRNIVDQQFRVDFAPAV